jgi:tetratricopeptide (TPR) repeat protein/transglutaminase-like putative cysteine protease
MRTPLLTSLVPLLLFVAAHTQTPALSPAAPSDVAKYAGESLVIENSEIRNVMAADGTGYTERTLSVRIQSEAALRELSVLTLPFASASQKVEILYAHVRRPDGTVIETPPSDALEQPEPVTKEAPFYSDLKDKQLPIKSLRVGDTLEWRARITRTKAEAPGNFWGNENFTTGAVTLAESVELRYPKTVFVTVWTNPKVGVKPVDSDEGADHVVRWQSSNLKPNTGAEADAAKAEKKKKLLTPDEELDQREGHLPSIAWTTFKSWAAVGAWYRSLESGRIQPDDEIKAKVAELTTGKSTEEEKVRAVYAFVAPQIRYIGVAFGIGRYQPHLASDVLQNQYGDCKDKHTLLAAMLTAIGLHPDAVLIGEGIRFNEAVPSPEAFNHLITHVVVNGQPIWLDATAEVAPYRVLAADLRDKQALVVPETGEAHIERTVATLPFPAFQNMKAVGSIDKNGVSDSRLTLTLRGDVELLYREILRQVPPAQYPDFVQRVSEGLGYGGKTSHPEIGRPEDTADPLTVAYDYHRDHADDWSSSTRIVAQLEPTSLPGIDDKDPPTSSIDLGGPFSEYSSSELKIPEKWSAQLPEAVHEKAPYATFDESFRFEKGTVYAERKLVVLTRYIPASDWKAYKKWTDSIHLGEEMYIDLARGGDQSATGQTSPAPSVVITSNAEAARLVEKANNALNQRDLGGASQFLDQAKELNPSQKNLNGDYGALSFQRGEMTEAIRHYQREVALHPDSTWVYAPLARAQIAINHHDDAVASLRAWTSAAPDNPAATVALVELLLNGNDAAGALAAADKGLAALPEDRRGDSALQLSLGKAQIAAGQPDKGAATLVALLKNTDEVFTMNNAAYELSKAGKELPLAEEVERKQLATLDAESRSWTLNENPQTLRNKTALIVSSWDTLGWILYGEGKLKEAEDYISAAFSNSPHIEIGEHLGDIQSKLNDQQAALRTYQLTLAAVPSNNLLGVRTPPGPDTQRLKQKIDAEKKAGTKEKPIDGPAALKALRTIPLGAANGKTGHAEYVVLLSHQKIEKVQATTEKFVIGGAEAIAKLDPSRFAPAAVDTRLAKFAILNCHANTCELIFEP